MFQRVIFALIIFVAMLCFTTDTFAERKNMGDGNGRDYFFDNKANSLSFQSKLRDRFSDTYGKNDKWLVYWYVCGTDIESSRIAFKSINDLSHLIIGDERLPGDITRCIREVERATFPNDNVKIFMQAGGTNIWGHEKFRPLNATITLLEKDVKRDKVSGLYKLPEDVNNNLIDIKESAKIARYVYGKDERDWTPREIFPFNVNDLSTQMGSPECLKNFLRYGKEVIEPEFKPDHRVFIFVDHGSGSIDGVCLDKNLGEELNLTQEQTREYSLKLKGINDAFTEVFGSSKKNPPFEVIAFDTCLMGTYETALSLEGSTRYMVASEETIYGHAMFDYTGFLDVLSNNLAMSGAKLGKVICETYRDDVNKTVEEFSEITNVNWAKYNATMSVVDLRKLPSLKKAYDKFGAETLKYLQTREDCYSLITTLSKRNLALDKSDMIDLKDFVERINNFSNSSKLKNAHDKLLATLDGDNGAVIYQSLGRDKKECGGLSTYYESNFKNLDFYDGLVTDKFASAPQRDLYQYLRKKILGSSNKEVAFSLPVAINSSRQNVSLPTNFQGTVFDFSDLDSTPVYRDTDRKTVFVQLQKKDLGRISGVHRQLISITVKNEEDNRYLVIIYWGSDSNIDEDWNNGIFADTFSGKWLTINGKAVFVQVVSENTQRDDNGDKIDGSEVYAVPIILNDRYCNLMISCDYPGENYSIIGAVPMVEGENSDFMNSSGIGFNGNTTDGQIYGLRQGDIIKPLYIALVSSQEQLEEIYKEYEYFKDLDNEREEILVNELRKRGAFSVYEGEAFTVGDRDSITVEKGSLPNGNYVYAFEFINPVGEKNAYSEASAVFTIENGKISGLQDISEMSEEDLEK